jgi:hypothetical protein
LVIEALEVDPHGRIWCANYRWVEQTKGN